MSITPYLRPASIVGAVAACTLMITGPALAFAGDDPSKPYDVEEWVTLDGPVSADPDGKGDQFLNFDANWKDGGKSETSNKVDWPVNLIFVSKDPGRLSTSKVKDVVASAFPHMGGAMNARMLRQDDKGVWSYQWDSDNGRKVYPGKCKNEPDTNYHFRVYAPDGEGRLRHPGYGYFVIGTSHIDYRESCSTGEHWSGQSEAAETYIAGVFEQRGKRVERNKIYLGNAKNVGGSTSDGYATVIHID